MIVDDRACQDRGRRSRSAECVMPAVAGAGPAFRRFAHEAAQRWELPEEFCEVVARIAFDLFQELTGLGTGLDTYLMLAVDDVAVTVRVREAGRPRPAVREATARGGRGTPSTVRSSAPRRPVGGARLEAVVLLPEPAQV